MPARFGRIPFRCRSQGLGSPRKPSSARNAKIFFRNGVASSEQKHPQLPFRPKTSSAARKARAGFRQSGSGRFRVSFQRDVTDIADLELVSIQLLLPRHATEVAHRELGIALGEGDKFVQRCWLVRRHNSDSRGIARSEQAHRRGRVQD